MLNLIGRSFSIYPINILRLQEEAEFYGIACRFARTSEGKSPLEITRSLHRELIK